MCGMAGLPAVPRVVLRAQLAVAWPALKTFPAWGSDERPASAVGSVVLDWSASKQELEQLVQQALDSDDTAPGLSSSTRVFMGYPLYLHIQVHADGSGSTAAGAAPGSKSL
jgi:hypothetical protein